MCWKINAYEKPAVSARDLVPSTSATEPESPEFGDGTESYATKRGKDALKIALDSTTKTT